MILRYGGWLNCWGEGKDAREFRIGLKICRVGGRREMKNLGAGKLKESYKDVKWFEHIELGGE